MALIRRTSIEAVRTRASLEEVVGAHVRLQRTGASLKGLCPFHGEKTPSFHVHPAKGFYHCFGCGKSGDVIRFVMDLENRDFTEAVEALAQRFGIQLEYEEGAGPSAEERSLRQELLEMHAAAAAYFRGVFLGQDATATFARTYWETRRRFTPELAEEFGIGFAPADDSGLPAHLRRKGFSHTALEQSGLVRVRGGAARAFFRGRLIVPIRDVQDRIVAFTARQTDLTPQEDPTREAKYVNSPETPIFRKGELLFNLARARPHARDGAPFLMVEGQLDCLRCWSVGLRATVAPQGTAVTPAQLALLRRSSPRIEVFLDGDNAGRKAALRLLPLALQEGLELTFLPLEPGQDPDSWFRERGADGLEPLRARRLSPMRFACAAHLPDPAAATPEARAAACREIFTVLENCASEVARAGHLQEAAPLLLGGGASADTLLGDFRRHLAQKRTRAPGAAAAPVAPEAPAGPAPSPLDDDALAFVLHFPEWRAPFAQAVDPAWLNAASPAGRLLDRCLADIQFGVWEGEGHAGQLAEGDDEQACLARVQVLVPQRDDPLQMANLLVAKLHERALRRELDVLARAIVEAGHDLQRLEPLYAERKQLLAKLRAPPTVSRFP